MTNIREHLYQSVISGQFFKRHSLDSLHRKEMLQKKTVTSALLHSSTASGFLLSFAQVGAGHARGRDLRVHVAEAPGLLEARRADLRVEPPQERAEDLLGLRRA